MINLAAIVAFSLIGGLFLSPSIAFGSNKDCYKGEDVGLCMELCRQDDSKACEELTYLCNDKKNYKACGFTCESGDSAGCDILKKACVYGFGNSCQEMCGAKNEEPLSMGCLHKADSCCRKLATIYPEKAIKLCNENSSYATCSMLCTDNVDEKFREEAFKTGCEKQAGLATCCDRLALEYTEDALDACESGNKTMCSALCNNKISDEFKEEAYGLGCENGIVTCCEKNVVVSADVTIAECEKGNKTMCSALCSDDISDEFKKEAYKTGCDKGSNDTCCEKLSKIDSEILVGLCKDGNASACNYACSTTNGDFVDIGCEKHANKCCLKLLAEDPEYSNNLCTDGDINMCSLICKNDITEASFENSYYKGCREGKNDMCCEKLGIVAPVSLNRSCAEGSERSCVIAACNEIQKDVNNINYLIGHHKPYMKSSSENNSGNKLKLYSAVEEQYQDKDPIVEAVNSDNQYKYYVSVTCSYEFNQKIKLLIFRDIAAPDKFLAVYPKVRSDSIVVVPAVYKKNCTLWGDVGCYGCNKICLQYETSMVTSAQYKSIYSPAEYWVIIEMASSDPSLNKRKNIVYEDLFKLNKGYDVLRADLRRQYDE